MHICLTFIFIEELLFTHEIWVLRGDHYFHHGRSYNVSIQKTQWACCTGFE